MALTQPTVPSGGFPLGEVQKIFAKRCRIYYSKGDLTGETLPTTKATVNTLRTGKFVPMGAFNNGVGSLKFKQNTAKIDFNTVNTDLTVTAELTSVRVYPDFLTFLDGSDADGLLSLMIVPEGDDGTTMLLLNGVTMVFDGEIKLDGNMGEIKLTFERYANTISDAIKYTLMST